MTLSVIDSDYFEKALKESQISPKYQPYYKHWLNSYLQFCTKYQLPEKNKDSLDPFLKSLAKNNLKDFQITQANHAVFLFYLMHDEKSSITTNLPEKSTTPTNSQIQDFRNCWEELKERFAIEIKLRHYSPNTFDGYGGHIRKFAEFCNWKDPDTITSFDAKKFLALMATKWKCSASSQNVAFHSLLFFFRFVIKKPYENLKDTPRAKTKKPVPQILSREEITAILRHLRPPYSLIAKLTYGCGLRLEEVMSLRVQNFNIDDKMLNVCFGKGGKSRCLPLPEAAINEINNQMCYVRNLHKTDLEQNYDGAILPIEVERKSPDAGRELLWQ